jgi:hypothetical protein
MRKLSFIAAIVACVALPSVALAAHGSHHRSHGHGGHDVGAQGAPLPAERPIGHGRYWQGQWYEEGVGSCWMGAPNGFVWICG